MDMQSIHFQSNHKAVVDRFTAACQADRRVVASALGGSYARGTTDEHSDIDFGLVTTDEDHDEFRETIDEFARLLGEPAFLENFDNPMFAFIILPDGTEIEISLGRESQFDQIQYGPYVTLVDKKGILDGVVFTGRQPSQAEQVETLRRQVYWFWHDLSHFTKAMGRGQLLWAGGQLEVLRQICVNLARMSQDFSAKAIAYEKVDEALSEQQLLSFQPTFSTMEEGELLRAGLATIQLYRNLAVPLAEEHGIVYPDSLDRAMSGRLEHLVSQKLG